MTDPVTSAPPPVNIGIIGAGTMGGKHAGFIAEGEHAALVGVADPFSGQLATAPLGAGGEMA